MTVPPRCPTTACARETASTLTSVPLRELTSTAIPLGSGASALETMPTSGRAVMRALAGVLTSSWVRVVRRSLAWASVPECHQSSRGTMRALGTDATIR